MENHLPDEFLIDFVFMKPGEDIFTEQASISLASLKQSPTSTASQIFSQISTKFSRKVQSFLEFVISPSFGLNDDLRHIFIYVAVLTLVDEGGVGEIVIDHQPSIFVKNPRENPNINFSDFAARVMKAIQQMERQFKSRIFRVNKFIEKYREPAKQEELSISSEQLEVLCHEMRQNCYRMFCSNCMKEPFPRGGYCLLCRSPYYLT